MSTLGEQSILEMLLHGRPPLSGLETEMTRPLAHQSSANIPRLAQAAHNEHARRRRDLPALADGALLWEADLEPGQRDLMMWHEFGAAVYPHWIVCPISLAYYVHRTHAAGQLAAERARLWCRAWAALWSLTLAQVEGLLISDQDDPPEERAGPVFATCTEDPRTYPSNGTSIVRRRRGLLACVAVGERAVQRDWHEPDECWRLMRPYLDQHTIAQVVQLALDIPFTQQLDPENGDWACLFLQGLRRTFGPETRILPLSDEELETIRAARTPDGRAARRTLRDWMQPYRPAKAFTLARTEGGLWMLLHAGGDTSTAPKYGGTCEESSGKQGFLFCDTGRRKSNGAPDAISHGRGWEGSGELVCARDDGRNGTRRMDKPTGREIWRLDGDPDTGYTLSEGGAVVAATPAQDEVLTPSTDQTPAEAVAYPDCYHQATAWVRDRLWAAAPQIVAHGTTAERNYLAGELRAVARQLDGKK